MVVEDKVEITYGWGKSMYLLNQSWILSWTWFIHKAEFCEALEIQILPDTLSVATAYNFLFCFHYSCCKNAQINNLEAIYVENEKSAC